MIFGFHQFMRCRLLANCYFIFREMFQRLLVSGSLIKSLCILENYYKFNKNFHYLIALIYIYVYIYVWFMFDLVQYSNFRFCSKRLYIFAMSNLKLKCYCEISFFFCEFGLSFRERNNGTIFFFLFFKTWIRHNLIRPTPLNIQYFLTLYSFFLTKSHLNWHW